MNRAFLRRHQAAIALFVVIVGGLALYTYDLSKNPPGFFIDESSVAYNAYTISQSGRDESGSAWPLYFRAFGEYKNPIYIYLLAGLFRVTGPGMLAARCLSAVLGVATALLLGLLAARISGRQPAGLLVALTALLTPWLFELSRLVLEVTLYPFIVALFLFCAWRASAKLIWRWTEVATLAATLALLTYTYSIGRLLAPLLAAGLFFFLSRRRFPGILLTLGAYAITLVPLLVIRARRPEVLSARFNIVTYIVPQSTLSEITRGFVRRYVFNVNPWALFVREPSRVSEIVHLPGAPAMLSMTAILLVGSILLLVYRREFSAWWTFVVYGLIVSIVPASLTRDYFHMLRLSALPVFLITLTIPAFVWLTEGHTRAKRAGLLMTALLILAQGAVFQWEYHVSAQSPQRRHIFDADYPAKIFPAALTSASSAPVYLADNPARLAYIQAYWYATLQQVPLSKFVSLGFDKPAPEGAVVITTESECPRCRVLVGSEPYTTYIATGPPRIISALPPEGLHAEIRPIASPQNLRTGEAAILHVIVKNTSAVPWPARERSAAPYQISVGNHWLDLEGKPVVNDDGRGALTRDLKPGEEAEIFFNINAPHHAGNYLLEIDMLQEDVSWFGLKGSPTVRVPIAVQ